LYRDEYLRVPLSSVDQSSGLIGKEAARIALQILNSKVPPPPETVILKPQLMVRGSTERF
jgi:DNA-binding LacI/PurR family transcriptional regulator